MVYDLIKSSLINIWPSLIIVSITLISLRLAYSFNYHNTICFYKEFWTFVAIIYLLILFELVTRVDMNTMSGVNLIPFKEITRYQIGSRLFYLDVIGNILLFIPFGYIISYYIKSKKITFAIIIPLVVSFTIELVQLKIGRSFDIDDILLNTIGCIIGYLLYKLSLKIHNKLPDFVKSKVFNNLLCIVIIICIVIYIFSFWGAKIIK